MLCIKVDNKMLRTGHVNYGLWFITNEFSSEKTYDYNSF